MRRRNVTYDGQRYRTAAWLALRQAVLRRDGGFCTTPGCGWPATIVDHIISPRNGGTDGMGNLRSLCRRCDNSVKEAHDRTRRNGGRLTAIGCDAEGNLLDPNSQWHQ